MNCGATPTTTRSAVATTSAAVIRADTTIGVSLRGSCA